MHMNTPNPAELRDNDLDSASSSDEYPEDDNLIVKNEINVKPSLKNYIT